MANIIHYVRNSHPLQTGYTLRTQYLLRYLNRCGHKGTVFNCLESKGPDPAIIGIESGAAYLHNDVPYYWFDRQRNGNPGTDSEFRPKSRMWESLLKSSRIRKELKQYAAQITDAVGTPDIVHAHSSPDVGEEGYLLASHYKVPFIYEVRGFWKLSSATDRKQAISISKAVKKDVAIARKADHVVAICRGIADTLVSEGISSSKITIVPNGVDTAVFNPRPENIDLSSRLGLEGKVVFGYITNVRRLEGIQTVLEVWPDVVKEVPNAVFLLVGDGDYLEELNGFARDNNIEDSVLFVGKVPHENIFDFYSILDVFIIPRLPEPVCNIVTPLKPLEAMAMGIPVLASDVSALGEMVQDNVTGRHFKAGNRNDLKKLCIEMARNPDRLSVLSENALHWVQEKRGWSTLVSLYSDLYESIVTPL